MRPWTIKVATAKRRLYCALEVVSGMAADQCKPRKVLYEDPELGFCVCGHALEKASDYRHLKHGEAVGYGIVFAAILSKKLGLLDAKVVNLLCDVVHRAGKLPSIRNIKPTDVFEALCHAGVIRFFLFRVFQYHRIGSAADQRKFYGVVQIIFAKRRIISEK